MYYYYKDGRLITSSIPISGLTPKTLTSEEVNARNLSIALHSRLAECESVYQMKLNAGIEYNSKVYDSDDKAQKFITSLVTALNAGIITKFDGFTLKDDSEVNLTGNQIKELGAVLLSHVDTCHKWKQAKQAEINSCTSADQVRAVTF